MIATQLKSPVAILNYELNWSKWLNGQAVIVDSEWIVPDGLTKVVSSFNSIASLIRLSGGEVGKTYPIVNHIVCDSGDEDQRTVAIKIKDR